MKFKLINGKNEKKIEREKEISRIWAKIKNINFNYNKSVFLKYFLANFIHKKKKIIIKQLTSKEQVLQNYIKRRKLSKIGLLFINIH